MAYIDEINNLKAQQRQQALASLDTAKNNQMTNLTNTKNQGLATLDTEQKTIAPQYYDKRNQVSTTNDLAAKNFAEFMANRGGSSGTAAQANLLNNSALQNNIGSLNNQEVTANQGIATKKTDLNNTYNNNVLGINNGYQSDLANQYATIDSNAASQIAQYQKEQEQAAQQRAYEQQQATIAYQRQLALAQQAAAASAAKSSAKSSAANDKTAALNYYASQLQDNMKQGQGSDWLMQNRDALVQDLGVDGWTKLKSLDDPAAEQLGSMNYKKLLRNTQ